MPFFSFFLGFLFFISFIHSFIYSFLSFFLSFLITSSPFHLLILFPFLKIIPSFFLSSSHYCLHLHTVNCLLSAPLLTFHSHSLPVHILVFFFKQPHPATFITHCNTCGTVVPQLRNRFPGMNSEISWNLLQFPETEEGQSALVYR